MQPIHEAGKASLDDISERCKANAAHARTLPPSAEDERSRRIEIVRQQSDIPKRFALSTLPNFEVDESNREAFAAVWAFVERQFSASGVGLYGPVGVGKTRLLAAIGNAAIMAEKRALLITTSELMLRLRATFSSRDENELALIQRLVRTPVLLVDDFGKEQITEWSAQVLFDFVNARYNAGLPIVVAANASAKDLVRTKYSTAPEGVDPSLPLAIFDRIREMTGPWLEIGGKSRRRAS